ncbi:cytochrome P450 family protein [Ceratobasidium sp. AG-Ba]|nr:cytochrome P450 family protein [Ceratobasidium sp. AG-Ba]
MGSAAYELFLDSFILALIISLLIAWLGRRRQIPLPPSPQSDPFIGHLRRLPAVDEHLVFARMGEELNFFGQTTIILNSMKAAHELLDRRSAIYSDRPELPMLSLPSLVDCSKFTGFARYGERWRNQRRITHAVLHKKASEQLWPIILKQSRLAAQRLLKNPNNFFNEFRRMSGSAVLSAVYGYNVTSADDPLVKLVKTAISHIAEAAVPGAFYVNSMPWLRLIPDWFPGTTWKRTVKNWQAEKTDMIDVPFHWAKQQIAKGNASDSVIKALLRELESSKKEADDLEEEMDRIKWAAGTLFGAGADTSAATILVFVLAMTLYPEIQARAQAEIDEVVGTDRLPEMEDRSSLPYIERVLKEILRWQPVFPLGLAHACTQDSEYEGYRIPKGAVVIGNTWAISRNSLVYPNPEVFDPDRFLDPSVPSAPAFGFGRR